MMNNFAHLKPESPFYDLFTNGLCPIINIMVPSRAELEGSTETEVYMVDLKKLGEAKVWNKAGVDAQAVLSDIYSKGLPLRVSQTTGCSSDAPFFL